MINFPQLQRLLQDRRPQTAIILGSGLGAVADNIENPLIIDYADIEGFPRPGSRRTLGQNNRRPAGPTRSSLPAGTFSSLRRTCPAVDCRSGTGSQKLGILRLIVTNAAGSLNPELTPAV